MFASAITAAKGLACATTIMALASCQMAPASQTPQERGRATIADCVATSCATLNLDSINLTDYTALSTMTHLRSVMVSYTGFNDLGVLTPLTSLEEIHIGDTPVTDLSPLAGFPNLRLLHMQGVTTDDYRVLRQLTGLEVLAIGNTPIPNVVFARSMPNLKQLDLSYSQVRDLSALRRHPSLEVLNIDGIPTTNLSVLLTIPNLREVTVGNPEFTAKLAPEIARLRAAGINVTFEPVMIVC